MTFVDDQWDGTLGAAFTKLTVQNDTKGLKKLVPRKDSTGMTVHVESTLKQSPGFDEIAYGMENGYQAQLVEGPEPRVLIANAYNDAAKLGLHRGDVVTHVNGEEFVGTAEDLNFLIKAHFACSGASEKLELVVNAEPCIAQALKLRAFA